MFEESSMLSPGRFDAPPPEPQSRYRRSSFQILLPRTGAAVLGTADRSWVVWSGRAFVAASPLEVRTTGESEIVNIRLESSVMVLQGKDHGLVKVNSLARELILRIADLDRDVGTALPNDRQLFSDILAGELEPCGSPPVHLPVPQDARLRRICHELIKNPGDKRTLDAWSLTAGACSRTLSRLFLRETGLSFADWRRQARLLAATIRMAKGCPVTTAAIDAGYESTSAFIDMFKKYFGSTPGRFFR